MNVAMKVPRAQFGRTLAFYRDTLALTVREETGPEVLPWSAAACTST
jgi:hypothetical protein